MSAPYGATAYQYFIREYSPLVPATLMPCTQASRRLPDSIQLPADLHRDVQWMLERSETFRAQCLRLAAAPQVRVRVTINPQIGNEGHRPRSTITRYRSGAITAVIEISLRGPIEWIAHEFEHVVEQIDGIRVVELASQGRDAWCSGSGMFETARAIRAGRAVLTETRVKPGRSDRFVE